MLPTCVRHGMAVIAWSPLRGGVLSGRYRHGATGTSSARQVMRRLFDPKAPGTAERFEVAERLAVLADEHGMSVARPPVAPTVWARGPTNA